VPTIAIRFAENFRALFYAPFYATRALGLFADEGVEVEWLGSATPDLTWGGPMRVKCAGRPGQ
jgi:NitT/TauT family transport system substrate-binding protein